MKPDGHGSAVLERKDDVDLERDRTLVERCQHGDPRAFEDLYLRYRDRLYRYCLRRLQNSSEAEDAVQEAFARAWRALPTFEGEKRFYPWLSVIAGNLCIDMQKKRSRWTTVDDDDLDLLAPTSPAEQDAMSDAYGERDLLSRALGRLCERHREVLELREGRNWTYQQIAAHSGVEVSTIETLLFRARKSLKREFMALAQAEGALGVIFIPVFALRRLIRRGISAGKATAATLKGAVVAGSLPAAPAVGGAVAVVATAALLGTNVAALTSRPTPSVVAVSSNKSAASGHSPNGTAGASTSGGRSTVSGTAAAARASKQSPTTGSHSSHHGTAGSSGTSGLPSAGVPGSTPGGVGTAVNAATSTVGKVVHKVVKVVKHLPLPGGGGGVVSGLGGIGGLLP